MRPKIIPTKELRLKDTAFVCTPIDFRESMYEAVKKTTQQISRAGKLVEFQTLDKSEIEWLWCQQAVDCLRHSGETVTLWLPAPDGEVKYLKFVMPHWVNEFNDWFVKSKYINDDLTMAVQEMNDGQKLLILDAIKKVGLVPEVHLATSTGPLVGVEAINYLANRMRNI